MTVTEETQETNDNPEPKAPYVPAPQRIMYSDDVASSNMWLEQFDVALCLVTGENGLLLGMVNKGTFTLIGETIKGKVEVHITPDPEPVPEPEPGTETTPSPDPSGGTDGPPSPAPPATDPTG